MADKSDGNKSIARNKLDTTKKEIQNRMQGFKDSIKGMMETKNVQTQQQKFKTFNNLLFIFIVLIFIFVFKLVYMKYSEFTTFIVADGTSTKTTNADGTNTWASTDASGNAILKPVEGTSTSIMSQTMDTTFSKSSTPRFWNRS